MNYPYKIEDQLSTQEVISTYESHTFPSFKKKSGVRNLVEPFTVVKIEDQGKIAGLAVLEFVTNSAMGKQVKILSLFVSPEYRNKRIGSQLLQITQNIAKQKDYDFIDLIFQNNWDSFYILQKLFSNQGWIKPVERMMMCKISYTDYSKNDWSKKVKLPDAYKTFLWSDLSDADKEYILEKKQKENWFPDMISPFQLMRKPAASPSLGLKYNGKVVGWVIYHEIAPETLQVTSFFISPELQNSGASVALLVISIELLHKNGFEYVNFMFDMQNKAMTKLFEKRIAPHSNMVKILLGRKYLKNKAS